jgi:hypothetical protein
MSRNRAIAAFVFLCVGLLLAGCTTPPPPPAADCTPASYEQLPEGVLAFLCPDGTAEGVFVGSWAGFGLSAWTPDLDPKTEFDVTVLDAQCPPYTISVPTTPRVEVFPCAGPTTFDLSSDGPTVYVVGNTDVPAGWVWAVFP